MRVFLESNVFIVNLTHDNFVALLYVESEKRKGNGAKVSWDNVGRSE